MTKRPLSLLVLLLVVAMASAQTDDFKTYKKGRSGASRSGSSGASTSLNLRLEPFLGASACMATGDFIDYQKSFHSVSEAGTTFKGGIRPLVMGTGGVQVRYLPFGESTGDLSKLSLSLGIQYLQKGFVNQFKMTHDSPLGYNDVMDYREVYRHHYLSFPLQLRWGETWFGLLGLSFSSHFSSQRDQVLKREQSGAAAVNGGFSNDSKEVEGLPKEAFLGSQRDFILGGGYQFGERAGLMLRANIGGLTLAEDAPLNYNTFLLEFSFFTSFKL